MERQSSETLLDRHSGTEQNANIEIVNSQTCPPAAKKHQRERMRPIRGASPRAALLQSLHGALEAFESSTLSCSDAGVPFSVPSSTMAGLPLARLLRRCRLPSSAPADAPTSAGSKLWSIEVEGRGVAAARAARVTGGNESFQEASTAFRDPASERGCPRMRAASGS
jgi:hypothetical protein